MLPRTWSRTYIISIFLHLYISFQINSMLRRAKILLRKSSEKSAMCTCTWLGEKFKTSSPASFDLSKAIYKDEICFFSLSHRQNFTGLSFGPFCPRSRRFVVESMCLYLGGGPPAPAPPRGTQKSGNLGTKSPARKVFTLRCFPR